MKSLLWCSLCPKWKPSSYKDSVCTCQQRESRGRNESWGPHRNEVMKEVNSMFQKMLHGVKSQHLQLFTQQACQFLPVYYSGLTGNSTVTLLYYFVTTLHQTWQKKKKMLRCNHFLGSSFLYEGSRVTQNLYSIHLYDFLLFIHFLWQTPLRI